VRLYDDRGRWHDYATGDNGGILDLIQRALGCSRAAALRWLAEFAGMPLEHKSFTRDERRAWARRQAEYKRDLPIAQRWRRAALLLCDETLDALKTSAFDPTAKNSDPAKIQEMEAFATALNAKSETELVQEYRWWRDNHPSMTAAMVLSAQKRDAIERRALDQFVDSLQEGPDEEN
jgi:hypothetical protein